ncbi:MAG: glutathione S-transferase [Pontixanthobacter sp.]
MTYTLWGSPPSLYTGKLRSYLIKKRLPFVERFPSEPEFAARILPQVGRVVIPVLETPEGQVLQDSGDIIDWLETRHSEPALVPQTPVQSVISALFDAVGSEYLLALAMHYRWSYRAEQEDFLQAEFGRTMVPGQSREARRQMASATMSKFNAFLPGLGVFPQKIEALEAAYMDWLDALDEHFQYHPYLLGGRPCRGDFGMMASLFAHLGRDPVPAGLMKRRAPNLFRWTERMNLANIADGEFPAAGEDYLADDAIPESLEPLLRLVFRDWTPGLLADAECFNAWCTERATGDLVSQNGRPQVHPSLGEISYAWHGSEYTRNSAPHALWMFSSAIDRAKELNGSARSTFDALVSRNGGEAAFAIRLDRRMKRDANVLVLE